MPGLPLARFTVIDLTAHRAGPTAVRVLADWGAEVVRIEPPQGKTADAGLLGRRHGFDLQNLHRNKRGLTLDLKSAAGREVFFKLVERADVVVENYRTAVKHRLGIDYEACARVNPRIVYGSISGFGQDGPYGLRPGVDQIAQGMGGLMSVTGEPGRGPMRVGIPVCDLSAGLFLATGILTALLEREESGRGQWVQTSLLQAMVAMMDFQAARYLKDGEVPGQAGNEHPTSLPTGVFPTKDGHLNIAAGGDAMFRRLCRAIGLEGLPDDPRFDSYETRLANRAALHAALSARTVQETKAHWVELLNGAGVPCGPIYDMAEVFADPQVRHLGMAWPMDHPRLGSFPVVAPPVVMSRTGRTCGPRRPPPELGEHSDGILEELGYDAAAIAALRAQSVV